MDDSNGSFRIIPRGLVETSKGSSKSKEPGVLVFKESSLDSFSKNSKLCSPDEDTKFYCLHLDYAFGEIPQDTLESPLPLGDHWSSELLSKTSPHEVSTQYQYGNSQSYHSKNGPIWRSPFHQLDYHDLCPHQWLQSWPSGAKKLCLSCIPRILSQKDLLDYLQEAFLYANHPPKITNLILLFGDESICLNPLSSIVPNGKVKVSNQIQEHLTAVLSGLALASIEFETEDDALLFWSWANAGRIRLYGHTLRAIPDPSGYRVFGEAVAANFREDDLNPAKIPPCYCCSNPSISPSSTAQYTSSLLLPFVSKSFTFKVLKRLPFFIKNQIDVEWSTIHHGAIIRFPSDHHRDVCRTSQKYTFKNVNNEMIRASFFRLGQRVTPCIVLEEEYFSKEAEKASTPTRQNLVGTIETDTCNRPTTELFLFTPQNAADQTERSRAKRQRVESSGDVSKRKGTVASKKKARGPRKRISEETTEKDANKAGGQVLRAARHGEPRPTRKQIKHSQEQEHSGLNKEAQPLLVKEEKGVRDVSRKEGSRQEMRNGSVFTSRQSSAPNSAELPVPKRSIDIEDYEPKTRRRKPAADIGIGFPGTERVSSSDTGASPVLRRPTTRSTFAHYPQSSTHPTAESFSRRASAPAQETVARGAVAQETPTQEPLLQDVPPTTLVPTQSTVQQARRGRGRPKKLVR